VNKVVIIGAGKGGRALLEMFTGRSDRCDPRHRRRQPVGARLELACQLNIAAATDLPELVSDPRLDLIIDVTGNAEIQRVIHLLKPPHTEVKAVSRAQE
jgi:predicted dehydrogenase